MTRSLSQNIQQFYDASSPLWEKVWGEHMHHGYYGPTGQQSQERRQAQIDLINEFLRWGQVEQAQAIVDVGCGIGGSSLYLASKFAASVTGITLSPVQAARATTRAYEAGLQSRTEFLVADALAMPFADASFDLAWSLESGEHMPNKVQFLQECCRVLKPGGTLLFATWCHRPCQPPELPLSNQEQRLLKDIYRVYHLPYVLSLPEYEAIAQTLPLTAITTADWSIAVAPFWQEVMTSALSPGALWGLLTSGLQTLQAALALGMMSRGYQQGLIRYGLLKGIKTL
ncbi:MAG: methyltransferase domain-containing protein [Acaryochloridaceae cyanobacterium SU_2_1]|nr:methyltransferase domain-containing protein [Acaryochloridaceae cyanobacterium SU_2_1]NJM95020.1 methyltransferase domain-containing protein [Acaryochloridaceae cyanobacterium CSU_5_19]